jgi:hypothetical protein
MIKDGSLAVNAKGFVELPPLSFDTGLLAGVDNSL